MWEAHEGMGWWMVFGSVFWILFPALLAYLFVSATGRRTNTHELQADSPLGIAKRRLAAGEISHEEFERIRDALGR